LIFKVPRPLVGSENLCLHFLQFRSDETLAAHGGLLPRVMRRDVREVRFRDLDEVTEDRIETHFERLNPSARDFPLLQFGDPMLSVTRTFSQLIELRIEAVAEDAAFLQGEWRIIQQCVTQLSRQLRHLMQLLLETLREQLDAGGIRRTVCSKGEAIEEILQFALKLGNLLERNL